MKKMLDAVIREICFYQNITKKKLQSLGRKNEELYITRYAIKILYKYGYTSIRLIGRVLSKNHATIHYHLKKMKLKK